MGSEKVCAGGGGGGGGGGLRALRRRGGWSSKGARRSGPFFGVHSLFLRPLELGYELFLPQESALKILTILLRIQSWMKIMKKNHSAPPQPVAPARRPGPPCQSEKNLFSNFFFTLTYMAQNDQRDEAVILSHVCWGLGDPPPPPAGPDPTHQQPPPSPPPQLSSPKGGGGGSRKGARTPPPPQTFFSHSPSHSQSFEVFLQVGLWGSGAALDGPQSSPYGFRILGSNFHCLCPGGRDRTGTRNRKQNPT